MRFTYSQILVFALIAFVLPVSCADVETETNGFASLEISLDDVSHRKTGRSQLAASMTSSDAKTILGVLMPAVQCTNSSASSDIEYSRALVDISTYSAKFEVPLDTNVKLCLYFFRDKYTDINKLGAGTISPEGFGESKIFTIMVNPKFLPLTQKQFGWCFQLNSGPPLIQPLLSKSAVRAVQECSKAA